MDGLPTYYCSVGTRCEALVERVSTRTASRRLRIIDGETLFLDRILKVDRGSVEIRHAHLVDNDLDSIEVDGDISLEQTLVKVELVDEARASTGLHRNA